MAKSTRILRKSPSSAVGARVTATISSYSASGQRMFLRRPSPNSVHVHDRHRGHIPIPRCPAPRADSATRPITTRRPSPEGYLGQKVVVVRRSDRGGERAALVYSLIVTAKLNNVDPQAWLADVLSRLASHPASRLDELLPWNWRPAGAAKAAIDRAA